MNERLRYVLALIAGLLAIPVLALAANGALSGDEPGEEYAEEIAPVATETTVTTAMSAEDLVRACGVEGHYLVELEAVTAIDQIQQAALNALRPICQEAGLPLPAGPVIEGETIVETVTVVRTIPGPAAAPNAPTSSTTTTTIVERTAPAPHVRDDAAEALHGRDQALAAVDEAIAVGGKVDKINEAIALIERGDTAYQGGDYARAEDVYEEAEKKAKEAQRELEEHHEHEGDDDEHEDDHEDDEEDD